MATDHLATMVRESAERFSSQPAMRYQVGDTWRSISYAELGERITSVAKALVEARVRVGEMVGIFSPNRPEWAISDFAILSVGAVSVPLYSTSTVKQAAYIITDANIAVIFVGDQDQYDTVVAARGDLPHLRRIIAFDEATVLTGADSQHFSSFVAAGAASSRNALLTELNERLAAASTDDVATLVYTSGTTGEPKGAVLSHANFIHQVRALEERFDVGPGDRSLCFLPLSHAYERGWSYYVFSCGAENCYVQDPRNVVAVMAEIRPTTMVSVPRLYEKIHATVLDNVAQGSAIKASLFRWAIRVGGKYQERAYAGQSIGPMLRMSHALADRLVLARIREVVGGPKKVFSAGGAPLSKDIEEFFFATGLFICQGYGLTETAALFTCNYPGAFRFGTVGTPVLGNEVRIASNGEIQIRGGSIMSGYYGKPEATAAAFEEGWFRTGDVGMVDADGFLLITDRIKDLIITSQGKNVAPQHVEAVLGADPLIEQLVVIGDRRNYLCALIEPAYPILERYADEKHIAYASREELVAHPEVLALYDARIAALSTELAGYEQVKKFTLVAQPFTQEGGQLTPTMKIRRPVIEQQFGDVIDAMYDSPRADP